MYSEWCARTDGGQEQDLEVVIYQNAYSLAEHSFKWTKQ